MAQTRSGWRGHSLTASQCPGSSSAESAQFGHRPRCQRVQWLKGRDRISGGPIATEGVESAYSSGVMF